MRAGVLSDEKNIEFLNENFINTWISNVELERTPNKKQLNTLRRQQGFKPFDKTHPLAQAIMKGWKKHSPADTLVLSSELELLGRLPVNERGAPYNGAKGYLLFLTESLERKLPGLHEATLKPTKIDWDTLVESGAIADDDLNVVLTNGKAQQEVLSVFRTQSYTIVEIDVTAYKDGGMLSIEVWIGDADLSGTFDLFSGDTQPPVELVPENVLASAKDIPPDERKTINYRFDKGRVFKLGAIGKNNEKGKINGFMANISVKPVPEDRDE
ncbi:hypothetical protein F4212_14565 [Candidatus Poribacteria bacterium]|nr:hypothetical protein [Candidatus Poribacteria bacterium]